MVSTHSGKGEYAGSIKVKGGAELVSAKNLWNIQINMQLAET